MVQLEYTSSTMGTCTSCHLKSSEPFRMSSLIIFLKFIPTVSSYLGSLGLSKRRKLAVTPLYCVNCGNFMPVISTFLLAVKLPDWLTQVTLLLIFFLISPLYDPLQGFEMIRCQHALKIIFLLQTFNYW